MTTYAINTALNGIEITFDAKPCDAIREELKSAGFRWHKVKKLWYATNTAERLELAEKLHGGVYEEGKQREAGIALTVEKMNAIQDAYTFKQTGQGIYTGWTGDRCHAWKTQDELKAAIIAELKKHGIKAAIRQGRGGYTIHLTITITIPKECQQSEAEYIATADGKAHTGRFWYYDKDGNDIHRDNLPADYEERQAILKETLRREYESARGEQAEILAKPEFVELVKAIVSSFNSDHSNSMVDYFDVSFYETFNWKQEK